MVEASYFEISCTSKKGHFEASVCNSVMLKNKILTNRTKQKAEKINYVMAECVNHESNRSVASEAKAEKCGLIES